MLAACDILGEMINNNDNNDNNNNNNSNNNIDQNIANYIPITTMSAKVYEDLTRNLDMDTCDLATYWQETFFNTNHYECGELEYYY